MASGIKHFQSYYLNPKCSDVTLCVTLNDDRCLKIPSHKFVLASGSPVFEKMLDQDKFEEGTSGVANITIPGGELVAREFVRFFYYGKVQINSLEGGIALLKAAHLYEVDRLLNLSEEIILDILSPDNACEIYEETKLLGSSKYKDAIFSLVLRSAFDIFNKSYHLSLSEEGMTTILKSDFLNVISEKQVVDALWSWGDWKTIIEGTGSSVIDIIQRIQDIAQHVRWGLLTKDDLIGAEKTWEHLAAMYDVNKNSTVRKPNGTTSLVKYSRDINLQNASKTTHFANEWYKDETENVLLRFSSDQQLLLIALELVLLIDKSIIDRVSDYIELILDQKMECLAQWKLSTFGVIEHGTDMLPYLLLLELDKPVIFSKITPHVISLKINCDPSSILIPRYDVGDVVNTPGNELCESVNIIPHEKKISVRKLFCFLE